jgi:hypothetical protein
VDATLLECWTGGRYVRSVYAPEPPLCAGFAGVALKCEGTIAPGFMIYDLRFMIWIERLRPPPARGRALQPTALFFSRRSRGSRFKKQLSVAGSL